MKSTENAAGIKMFQSCTFIELLHILLLIIKHLHILYKVISAS